MAISLFEVKKGLRLRGSSSISDVLTGSEDPSVSPGLDAKKGSLYLRENGVTYKKTSVEGGDATSWVLNSQLEPGGLAWKNLTGASNVKAGFGYVLDGGTSYTVTLPSSPERGDVIGFSSLGTASTNPITVDLNGQNMNGSTDNWAIDLNYAYFELLYTGDATTGWVLSNTDESGNVDNLRSFVGNDDNSDPAVPEYTEANIVTAGDSLETSIDNLDIDAQDGANFSGRDPAVADDMPAYAEQNVVSSSESLETSVDKLDQEAQDAMNFVGKEADADDMPNYTERAGEIGTYSPSYITDEEDLELSIAKLDNELQNISATASAGVFWDKDILKAVTQDEITTGAGDYTTGDTFTGDTEPKYSYDSWTDGDQVLSLHSNTLGQIFHWDSSGDQWVLDATLDDNEAVAVKLDLPDDPASQEDGAAYKMNSDSTAVVKIADFDLETAESVGLSNTYAEDQSGTEVVTTDSVESAIQKLHGENANQDSVLGTARGDSNLGNSGDNVLSDNTDVKTAIDTLDDQVQDEANFTGRNSSSDDDMPDYSALAGDTMPSDYAPTNISDGDSLELSVAKLDEQTKNVANETKLTGVSSVTVVDSYNATGNVGAKWMVFVWDGSGNRYAAEIFAMNNNSNADATEYGILELGTLSVSFTVAMNSGSVELTLDPNGSTVSVKAQRSLISE